MTSNAYCSTEKLVDILNDIFNELSLDEQFTMVYLSTYLREKGNNVDEESVKNSLHFLADLCSPMLSFESRNAPFVPLATLGNKRSFMPYDLNNEQLDYMKNVLKKINQPQLKARISDILWTYSSPKDIQNLQVAVENYISINICDEYFQPDIYAFKEILDKRIAVWLLLIFTS